MKYEELDFEKTKKALLALSERLNEIDKQKTTGVNVFYAVGMLRQEIKHSAFLAWLLAPNNPHGFGSLFLRKFLERLFVHPNLEGDRDSEPRLKTNAEVLAQFSHAKTVNDLEDFLCADDVTVLTERPVDLDGRIDIFVESPSAKTLIAIENKVFTTTHDNQLSRYEAEFADRTDWKRIYVYLTPRGDMPNDFGEYRENWCVFSYETVLSIIREFTKDKIGRKLKYIMEDYIEMVETEILQKKKELRTLCKQIRREHKDALEILLNYTDNLEEVTSYCAEWFRQNIPSLIELKSGNTTFEFYTKPMADFFLHYNQNFCVDGTSLWKCRCVFGYGENVPVVTSLQKGENEEWDVAHKSIRNIFAPTKPLGKKYFSLKEYSATLLSAEEREQDFSSIKPQLDERLKLFAEKLKQFEIKLLENM